MNLKQQVLVFGIVWLNAFARADFGVDINVDPDLVTSSSACLDDCLKKGDSFCQSKDSKESGYCCDDTDCSKYGTDFGLCSNEVQSSVV